MDFGHLQTAPENRGCMFQVAGNASALCVSDRAASFEEGTAISTYGLLPEPTRGAAISALPGAIVRLYAAYFSPQRPAQEWRQTAQQHLSALPQQQTTVTATTTATTANGAGAESDNSEEALLGRVRVPIQKDVEAVFGRHVKSSTTATTTNNNNNNNSNSASGSSGDGMALEMYRSPQKISQVFFVTATDNSGGDAQIARPLLPLLFRAAYQGAYCAAIATGAQKLFLTVPDAAATPLALEEIVAAHKAFAMSGPTQHSLAEVHVVLPTTPDVQALSAFAVALNNAQIPFRHNEGQLW